MQPSDLRGVLSYITRFREKTFVLSIDSDVVADDQFRNLLLDITVLRSLNFKIVLIYGITSQVQSISSESDMVISNADGMGITDDNTLNISIRAAHVVGNKILQQLSEVNQRAALTNAVVAHPFGIKDGQDLLNTGRVEKVDAEFLKTLLDNGILPLVPPLGYDGEGNTYRVNSDGVALEVAEALRGAKLMYVTNHNGVEDAGKLSAQFSVEEIQQYLADENNKREISEDLFSKLEHGVRACRNGVNRAHIIDGTKPDSLLDEIFSNEGIGTMIYANQYEAIRRAQKRDIGAILRLVKDPVHWQELLPRGRSELENYYQDWYLFEIDRNIVGCVMLHVFQDAPECAEMGSLVVSHAHENQGIGSKLLAFAEKKARELGVTKLFGLSTQAYNYLKKKGGYEEASYEMLPSSRRERYEVSGRNSKVLVKMLK
ncbi:MAG: amino-acid N-acetyltransferase [Verrucomicrobiota bacterium]